jgi:DnaJ-class molecular chaperone
MRDPYDVLGVSRASSAETIKQAYRKLAKQLHPDLNPGDVAIETRFKEISAAYDLLSDAEKRAKFDRGEIDATGAERPNARYYRAYAGKQAPPGGGAGAGAGRGPFGNFEADDIFEMFNEGMRRREGKGRANHEMPKKRGADVNYSMSVDFVAAATGTKRRLTLPDNRTLDVAIPPGTADGTVLRLRGQGQPGFGGEAPGDAFIEVQVEQHLFFSRKENDIHVEVPVTIQEAALGATITVPTIEGKVAVKVPRGSNTGTMLRLKGRGVQGTKAAGRGDQYVRLYVVLPDKPDDELKDFLERWGPGHGYKVRGKLGIDD